VIDGKSDSSSIGRDNVDLAQELGSAGSAAGLRSTGILLNEIGHSKTAGKRGNYTFHINWFGEDRTSFWGVLEVG